MKEKWAIKDDQHDSNGQPVGLLYSYSFNRDKWLGSSKMLSPRAIDNYNRVAITHRACDNDATGSQNHLEADASLSDGASVESAASGFSGETLTLADSERTDPTTIGSTMRLTQSPSSNAISRCWSWVPRLERGLNCVSLAACFGNVVRLPVSVMLHGGIPFLVSYAVLMLLVGLPLVFLELGIGQIVQQGLTKTWRAVPMFRGVGYVKLLANIIVCIYYPLYIGLALYYLVWLAKGSVPFLECAHVQMTASGYRTAGISGEQCLKKTFLQSAFVEPKWFGMYAGFIATIWLIIMLCSFRKIKVYMRSMNCFFVPTFLCLFALLIKAVYHEIEFDVLKNLCKNVDWALLLRAEVWYYATIQLFFSTHLGFGNVVTCAGKVYSKAHPFWAALGYVLFSIITSAVSVIGCYILVGDVSPEERSVNITELYLFDAIYDSGVRHGSTLHIWLVVFYFTIFLSGFISMLAVMYTILKAIRVESRSKWRWWQVTLLLSIIFLICGILTILVQDFQIVHVLDHYIVGNLLLLTTTLEVIAFAYFYGCTNIYLDFEFILGSSLTIIWKLLWCLIPIILVTVCAWALATIRLTGIDPHEDSLWMYTTGWSIVVVCLIFILIVAIYEVYIQVDYNIVQKVASALKASRKWGPVDPMLRHGWIQWRSTAGAGDRDFTLKRRGTRDYTHSIKNRRRTPQSRTIPSTPTHSNRLSNEHLDNGPHALEVVAIMDTLERVPRPRAFKSQATTLDSNSEGYGTIRNGPYVIANEEFDHVCWRRSSHEEATEL